MTTTANTCLGHNKVGEPCNAAPLEGSRWCFFHDPSKRQERREARRKGGSARHGRNIGQTGQVESVKLRTIDDCLSLLEREAGELLCLERSVTRTRALTSIVSEARTLITNFELEQRINVMERLMHVEKGKAVAT